MSAENAGCESDIMYGRGKRATKVESIVFLRCKRQRKRWMISTIVEIEHHVTNKPHGAWKTLQRKDVLLASGVNGLCRWFTKKHQ